MKSFKEFISEATNPEDKLQSSIHNQTDYGVVTPTPLTLIEVRNE